MVQSRPIEEQVVAIVGTASGIGRETAVQFASRGTKLVVADNDDAGLASLVDEIRGMGGQVVSVVADVASYPQVELVAQRAVQEYGRLDTWVHIAAVGLYATFLQTTPDDFKRVIDVNLMGQVYGAKAALPHIIRSGGGGLIHISSIEAKRALPYHSAYGSAKHGISGFLEALRVELQHLHLPVSVTEIMPASINTPFFDKARTKIGVKPQGVPPLYEPAIVARAILHAAERPQRDIIVGGAGKLLVLGQRLSPSLMDGAMRNFGFSSQRTDEPRSPDAPSDLLGPAGQYNRVEGDFGGKAFKHSFSTLLDLHPTVKAVAAVGAALGIGAYLAERSGAARSVQQRVVNR